MIGDEIREILNAEKDHGQQLNDLVDTFRNGRPPKELWPLLATDETALVSVAVWILSELSEELCGTTEIVERLRQLTEHSDPLVRFYALSAVFPFLNSTDPSTRDLLSRLAQDTNEGVRRIAHAASGRLTAPPVTRGSEVLARRSGE